jgi:hypothetical protein
MTSKHAEYQNQAEYCQQMADRATKEEQKAAWLTLANKWLALMEYRAGIERVSATLHSIEIVPERCDGTGA